MAVSATGDLAIADLRRRLQVFRRTPDGYKHAVTYALPAGVTARPSTRRRQGLVGALVASRHTRTM
jgi:hypothetical protein